MKKVLASYAELLGLKASNSEERMGVRYNTFNDNINGSIDIKLGLMLSVIYCIFPETEPEFFPGKPKVFSKSLSRNELDAHLFAAFLNDEKDRILKVADYMVRLANGELVSLEELLEMNDENKKVR